MRRRTKSAYARTVIARIFGGSLPPDTDLLDHDLSVRAINALFKSGIFTVDAVHKLDDDDLLALPGVGIRVVEELRTVLGGSHAGGRMHDIARARMAENGGDPGAIHVADLRMTYRATHPLVAAGLATVGQVEELSDRELLALPWFGTRSLYEYRSTVGKFLTELLGERKARRVLESWVSARDAGRRTNR